MLMTSAIVAATMSANNRIRMVVYQVRKERFNRWNQVSILLRSISKRLRSRIDYLWLQIDCDYLASQICLSRDAPSNFLRLLLD